MLAALRVIVNIFVAKGELEKNLFSVALQCLMTRLEQLNKQSTQEKNRLPVSLNKPPANQSKR